MWHKRVFYRGLLGALLIVALPLVADTSLRTSQPDIVLFLVDDVGWQDTSVPFWYPTNGAHPRRTPLNERYQTPNQERMAQEGMLFSAAYASPVGTPTRVSLLTGMSAARHAVTAKVGAVDLPPPEAHVGEIAEANWARNGLQPPNTLPKGNTRNAFNHPEIAYPATELVAYDLQQPYCCAQTLPLLLERVGYVSILAGKAQVGAGNGVMPQDVVTPGQNPHLLGFEVNLYGSHVGHIEALSVATLTREALKAADTQEPIHPLFLYLSHFAASPTQQEALEAERYCDAIKALDASLGEVLEWAVDRKARTGREVMVIFMGDNGGRVQNAPLRAGRGSGYEGGIRVPLMVWMPGIVKSGAVSHTPVVSEDIFATVLDYAEMGEVSPLDCAQTPAVAAVDGQVRAQKIDGHSLRKLLEGQRARESSRMILIHYPHAGEPGFYTTLRMGEWKLIWNHLTGEKELYNVISDISEEKNQAKKRPSLVAKLSREMSKLLKERGAQLPKVKGKPIALPDDGAHHK